MPEKPLTIATYALGASLAAISLLYVFGPTFALDADPLSSNGKQRRIVGLENPANMCFVNSVLQALSNTPELRKYLIRETHRRMLDGNDVYKTRIEDVEGSGRVAASNQFKQDNLQSGIVTRALKIMLDRLNERPLYRKTISAQDFIAALETAFRTRISRQQQDAQEFLQLVLERLDDEYHAGRKARERYKARHLAITPIIDADPSRASNGDIPSPINGISESNGSVISVTAAEEIFPFEGKLEAQITCEVCGFEPKPSTSIFVTLTLNVPQVSQTSLNKCFDGLLKNERIEDFKCDKCRLLHAKDVKIRRAGATSDHLRRADFLSEISIIENALATDPEKPLPASVKMPSNPPSSTITRSMRISTFPHLLAIHLSRSIYSQSSLSTKNTARVSFPETLRVGGLRDSRTYILASVVMHKGGHNSGHYETFRRQAPAIPFSTPHSFGTTGPFSRQASPLPSGSTSLRDAATPSPVETEAIDSMRESTFSTIEEDPGNLPSSSTSISDQASTSSSRRSSSLSSFRMRRTLSTSKRNHHQQSATTPTSAPFNSSDSPPPTATTTATATAAAGTSTSDRHESSLSHRTRRLERRMARHQGPEGDEERRRLTKRRKRLAQRWWRVSDERVKECRTSDMLSMQREVYLLFYELAPPEMQGSATDGADGEGERREKGRRIDGSRRSEWTSGREERREDGRLVRELIERTKMR
jgi:ubiquitin carboxyl-terminal hydrolase 16